MNEFVFWYLFWLAVLLLSFHYVGFILAKMNNAWYKRLCREHYLKMVANDAIKKVLDDMEDKK